MPGGSDSKESACNAGDSVSIPRLEWSPGERNGYSSIIAWRIPWTEEPGRAPVHGVTNSWTWLKQQHSTYTLGDLQPRLRTTILFHSAVFWKSKLNGAKNSTCKIYTRGPIAATVALQLVASAMSISLTAFEITVFYWCDWCHLALSIFQSRFQELR